LADIAHTLLKVAPYDAGTMKCTGLRRSVVFFPSFVVDVCFISSIIYRIYTYMQSTVLRSTVLRIRVSLHNVM